MIRLLILLTLLSCGKAEDGSDGVSGIDGLNYYSYLVNVNIQKIIGDPQDESVIITDSNLYQLPSNFEVNVDNIYPECILQDMELIVETEKEKLSLIFQSTENRYSMSLKSGPANKYVDSSYLKIYYEKVPEVDCGDAVYKLHSGVSFQIRVFKEIKLE
jgi:hypothetical protein